MIRWREFTLLAVWSTLAVVFGRTTDFPPVTTSRTYQGLIREDAAELAEVDLDMPILARDKSSLAGDEICAYTVYKTHSELPFKVVVTDRQSGAAKIVLAEGYKLNYERRHRYSFEIAPRDCTTGRHAEKEMVHISVQDVNEYSPQPDQDSYMVEVTEGKLYEEILRLRSHDRDVTAQFASICHYNILTPDVPFRIDSDGVLYNTEPLDYSRKHNYILEVRVEDCGQVTSRPSNKVLINVNVNEACKAGWTGLAERIEYEAGLDTQPIGADASLETCDGTCAEKQVSARVVLTTTHIGKGCDRDTYSLQSQRKLCGASTSSVDLLPSPAVASWTRPLPTDDGKESDEIFSFDGKTTIVEVPNDEFNHTLSQHFTLATWMKHEENPEDENPHGTKEHILCNADGEGMRRHHYSLFVHHCRLVFLLRQEPYDHDLNVFKPAEWRWKLPQVCDAEWHHYAVSMDFPQIRLYVDGKLFVAEKSNPEIIDDWPLHPSKKIHFTKMAVGACWQGADGNFAHHFRGYLAGLSLLRDATESDQTIRCLTDCKEKLDFHAMSEMETGMSVAFNSEMTEITINGHNHTEVAKLVRRIGYINTRTFPTPGQRALTVETTLTCFDGRKLSIPDAHTSVVVQAAETPVITLSGATDLAYTESELLNGQYLYRDLHILTQARRTEEEIEGTLEDRGQELLMPPPVDENAQLDSCLISVDSPLKLDTEHIRWPKNLMAQLDLEASHSAEGLVISGADKLFNYEEVLREIQYVNRQPEDKTERAFTLTCSELNGRFLSNEFTVRVDIIHTIKSFANVPQAHHIGDDRMSARPVSSYLANELDLEEKSFEKSFVPRQNNFRYSSSYYNEGSHGMGVTVIVVVCVGFLVFMIVLGIIRIRAAHQRTQVVTVDEKPEMEWDNSGLTITINPMEAEVTAPGGEPLYPDGEGGDLQAADSDSEDDDEVSEDYRDDLESSEDEPEVKVTKDRGDLEWDDSTLSF